MTPRRNTFVSFIKNHDVIIFFSNNLEKTQFWPNIFLKFAKKPLGHSGAFGGIWGQISTIAKSSQIIPQNEVEEGFRESFITILEIYLIISCVIIIYRGFLISRPRVQARMKKSMSDYCIRSDPESQKKIKFESRSRISK